METLAEVKSFKYPKFFNGRKYEQAIEWLGSALFTSTSSREASHKTIKNAYRHTNKQGVHAVDQVTPALVLQRPELRLCRLF